MTKTLDLDNEPLPRTISEILEDGGTPEERGFLRQTIEEMRQTHAAIAADLVSLSARFAHSCVDYAYLEKMARREHDDAF